ncbi:MAG: type 2 isopentenyl-diphosphate Delta-isomerase [Methanosarcinales archaeon]
MSTSSRKMEHLKICAEKQVEATTETEHRQSGFDDIHLVHQALPEISKREIDTSTRFFDKNFAAPIMIASMTGGHSATLKVNENLALAASELGIGIGVGSQRAALENKDEEASFRIVRDVAPDLFIHANIGACQLKEYGVKGALKAVEMIDADALAIHLNFLQEAIQPEGETNATGCLSIIHRVCNELSVPVIAKETGAGISRETAGALVDAGVSAIDVGGMGGTSWAGVEVYRAKARGDQLCERLGELFWNWGIPTAASIIECRGHVPVIATGGIRNGVDILKSLALGASLTGLALPLVKPAMESKKEVVKVLQEIIEELKTAMFLTGCANINDAKTLPFVTTGSLHEWLQGRNDNIKRYKIKKEENETIKTG